jgi:hypothetical protein
VGAAPDPGPDQADPASDVRVATLVEPADGRLFATQRGLELSASILGGVGVTDRGEMVNSVGTGLSVGVVHDSFTRPLYARRDLGKHA